MFPFRRRFQAVMYVGLLRSLYADSTEEQHFSRENSLPGDGAAERMLREPNVASR
jgi:hypothetical protein